MKELLLIGLFCLCFYKSNSQNKPVLNLNSYKGWGTLAGGEKINNNGTYASYFIMNRPIDSTTLVLQSTITSWKRELIGVTFAIFLNDNIHIIYRIGNQLIKLKLGTSEEIELSNTCVLVKNTMDIKWIAYTDKENRLVLQKCDSGIKIKFNQIEKSEFSRSNNTLLLVKKNLSEENSSSLLWVELKSKTIKNIGHLTSNTLASANFIFDNSGSKMFFYVQQGLTYNSRTLIYFYDNYKFKSFQQLLDNKLIRKDFGIGKNQSGCKFDMLGNTIFFYVEKELKLPSKDLSLASVDVWNYKDQLLPTLQPSRLKKSEFLVAFNISDKNVSYLELENDDFLVFSNYGDKSVGKYVVSSQTKHLLTYWWNKEYSQDIYLISCIDGTRKLIYRSVKDKITPILSPSEKYVIWYQNSTRSYYSYEISNGFVKEISKDIPYSVYDDQKAGPNKQINYGIAGWLKQDCSILIYDQYDLWRVDPKGQKTPINITKGYGRENQIVLGVAKPSRDNVFTGEEKILLAGLNRETKFNGFFNCFINNKNPPLMSVFEPVYYCIPRTVGYARGVNLQTRYPLKAKEANSFIVTQMSAEKSENLYFTKDFKKFKQLSSIAPESKYNWITSELLHWKMSDGKMSKGILYKPENFDPLKKYPVIFHYYEEKSDELHSYLKPGLSDASINIPQYVSNGYLVFVPDIFYKQGHVGMGAVNSVVSAAKFLSSFSWVNSEKLGIQGQSFGGYETNYLVTHSDIFAAACTGSGTSNVISSYGQLSDGLEKAKKGNSRQYMFEIDQSFIGSTPYERPDLYIENSPIFKVDKVTTPLLIWHCKADGAVPFEQAIEMYINLRRAGKKVWMLQYDGDEHNTTGNNAVDLDSRMRQFFDFYLKDSPPPVWMTQGIPTSDKQIKAGLELDNSGVKP
jgi:dienelactone hydrolase